MHYTEPNDDRNMKTEAETAQSFVRLVHEGKIRPAICLLTEQSSGEKLNLNDDIASTGSGRELKTIRQVLVEKHPKGQSLWRSSQC